MALAFSTIEKREVKPVPMAAHADSRSISRRDLDAACPFSMLRGNPIDSVFRNCTWFYPPSHCSLNCERLEGKLDLGQRITVRHYHGRGDQHRDGEIHLMAGCSGNAAPFSAREPHGLSAEHLHGLLNS